MKKIASILALVGLTLTVASAAFANNNIANLKPVTSGVNDYNLTSGVLKTIGSGFLVDSSGPLTSSTNALFSFGPITEIGPAVPLGGSAILATFGGGSFSLIDNNGTGNVLLTGSFSGALLTSGNSSSGGVDNLVLNSVAYGSHTTDQYVQEFITKYGGGDPVTGNLSVSMSSFTPLLSNTGAGGQLANFNAQGAVTTFDGQSTSVVPESNSGLLMLAGLAPMGLLGMLVARRRNS